MRSILSAALWLAASTAGCALGPGTNFSVQDARRVRVGMSASQVRSIMGPPDSTRRAGERDRWEWSYLDASFTFRGKYCRVDLADGKVVGPPLWYDHIAETYDEYFRRPNITWVLTLPSTCFARLMYALAPREGLRRGWEDHSPSPGAARESKVDGSETLVPAAR